MIIREADINDAPSIARVTVDTWKTAYRGIIAEDYLNSLSYETRKQGWREFPFDTSFVYVAEDETGNIVGFAAAGPERENNPTYRGELYAIYVYDNYQNQGIGSALFTSVLKHLRQNSVNSLLLWVLSQSPYRCFYERHGGTPLESRMLEVDGLSNEITSYVWPDISELRIIP